MRVLLIDMSKFTLGANIRLIENKITLDEYKNVSIGNSQDIIDYARSYDVENVCLVGPTTLTDKYKRYIEDMTDIKVVNTITEIIKGGQA